MRDIAFFIRLLGKKWKKYKKVGCISINKNEALQSFYVLSKYLFDREEIENINKHKLDFSAFLIHSNHIKAYDFVAPYCKNKKVLDIGCFIGYGETCIREAKEIIAIDSDDKALEFAVEKENYQIYNLKR